VTPPQSIQPPPLTPAAHDDAVRLVRLALAEDLGLSRDEPNPNTVAADITTRLVPAELMGRAEFVVKKDGVLAGLPIARKVFEAVDPGFRSADPRHFFFARSADSRPVPAGEVIAEVDGPYRSLLTAERTALNFLQQLSGVATLTRRFVDAVAGTRATILDTRKTTPGMRLLEKYAVRCGGGANHRIGLHDMILIKDNHLVAFGGDPAAAVQAARAQNPGGRIPIEVEVTSIEQLERVLPLRPEFILLDNMTVAQLTECVRRRDAAFPKGDGPPLEASGGVNLDTVAAIARTGVERISVGALTHSAPALDISMEITPAADARR
jgi:nicotinate-nucleotide pyrophosphorylase (carboxylating)